MRGLLQAVCIIVIAVGGGLLAFSSRYEPPFGIADPAGFPRGTLSYENRNDLLTVSISGGIGMGFLILGSLGLVLPWVNQLESAMSGNMSDNSLRAIATVTVWLSTAVILTFGVFRLNWTGGGWA